MTKKQLIDALSTKLKRKNIPYPKWELESFVDPVLEVIVIIYLFFEKMGSFNPFLIIFVGNKYRMYIITKSFMFKFFLVLVLMSISVIGTQAQLARVAKVACVGNSITEGVGVQDASQDSYPAVLSRLLGKKYEVRNFGVSARTMLNKGDHPYMKEQKFRDALKFQPDIVTIKLGTNDSKPFNWKYKADFRKDLETLVDSFRKLPSNPEIFLCYPVPPTEVTWGINDSVIVHEIIPMIREVAQKKHTYIIDLHTPLLPYPQYFPDHVHPNEAGAALIAKKIYKALTKKRRFLRLRQPLFVLSETVVSV